MRNVFLLTLLSFSFSIYPIALFHGIVESCYMNKTATLVNSLKRDLGVHVECIEVGNGFMDTILMPLQKQVEIACENLNNNPNFQSKFSILGVSQGTLIGRYIIEKCNLKGQVMRYMSFDGPQMGIGSIPRLECGAVCDYLVKLTAPLFYRLQDRIGPAAYFRYRYDQAYYNEHNKFLKMLNNENEQKDPEIYKRITSLEKMKIIKSKNDDVINPVASSWFEFYDPEGNNIIPLEQSDFYIKDYIGLRKLAEEHKLEKAELSGKHIRYNTTEYWEELVDFFLDEPTQKKNLR